jgi:hypothetical protein
MANVSGVSVGMTPRRVLAEYYKNGWELDNSSSETLEDLIESGRPSGKFYFNTIKPLPGKLEVTFQYGKVIWVRQSYEIKEQDIDRAVASAKEYLARLGEFSESKSSNRLDYSLTYSRQTNAYVSYHFYKVIKDQKGYYVWLIACMY